MIKKKKVFVKCGDRLLRVKGWKEPTKSYKKIHTFVNQYNPDKTKKLNFR